MIRYALYKLLRFSGLPYLFRGLIQKNKVTILLFHDIDPANADKIFNYLNDRYNIINLKSFVKALRNKSQKKMPSKALIITFDDGHKRNYDLLPIIKKYDIPITIFLCAGIIGTNRRFWFEYAAADKTSDTNLKKVSNKERLKTLKEKGFKQTKEYSSRQALTIKEINKMKKIVDFQSHTLFHPCLPNCNYSTAKKEIFDSKKKLEDEFYLNIYAISYPNGDYSKRDIELCKEAGYECGITVDYGYNTLNTNPYKLKRFSVNDTDNLDELIVKSAGVWAFFKSKIKKLRHIFEKNREIR